MRLPRHANLWLPGYLRAARDARRERTHRRRPIDILLCIADHFEPLHGGASAADGQRRVDTWRERFPKLFARHVDADGRHPQHTFFYSIDQYSPEYLEGLKELCAAGFGEVEVQLHHNADQSESVRRKLLDFTGTL